MMHRGEPLGCAHQPLTRGCAPGIIRNRLHRRLFLAMGLAIFVTMATAGFLAHSMSAGPVGPERPSVQRFLAAQFARVWEDPEKRTALADETASSFLLTLELHALDGSLLSRHGNERCVGQKLSFPAQLSQGSRARGTIDLCTEAHEKVQRGTLVAALSCAGCVLWVFAGIIAHKLTLPLVRLTEVTREIGRGKLSSRARLGRHHSGEVGALARSINEMAERIERQIEGQRELLAGVSHEIRTPLARLRVVTEILRDQAVDEKSLANIEREIAEIDDLTGQLLASSRLEFESIDRRELDGIELAKTALERANLALEKLHVEGTPQPLAGDPTLLERALINLLENAKRHGQGLDALKVRFSSSKVAFTTLDSGPGFVPEDLKRAFEPFYRGKHSGKGASSLGLGLALVRRIARAHDGRVHASNRSPNGAEVTFELPLAAS